MWQYTGKQRPAFADSPGPGQESVWDYPRPPRLEACTREVRISHGTLELAHSRHNWRVLETASPPTFYLPPDAVDHSALLASDGSSFCEWKGAARYWVLADDPGGEPVAWSYPDPSAAFADIRDAFGFYPGRVDCFLDGERVQPQPGYFYGGWLTADIVGPVKGEPGTGHW